MTERSLSRTQMYLCQALLKGWPRELRDVLLTRCSASEGDWQDLLSRSVVEEKEGKYTLSRDGKRLFNSLRKTWKF